MGSAVATFYSFSGTVKLDYGERDGIRGSGTYPYVCNNLANAGVESTSQELIYSFTESRFAEKKISMPTQPAYSTYKSRGTYVSVPDYFINRINTWLQTLVGKQVVKFSGDSLSITKPTLLQIALDYSIESGWYESSDGSITWFELTIGSTKNNWYQVPITLNDEGIIQTVETFNPTDFTISANVTGTDLSLGWHANDLVIKAIPNGSASCTVSGTTIATN